MFITWIYNPLLTNSFPADTIAWNERFNNRMFAAYDSQGKIHLTYTGHFGTDGSTREIYYVKEDTAMRTDTKRVQLLPYEFSNKQVSPWGGMRIVQELVERIGLREILQRQKLPQPGSNRGYNPVDIVMSFLVSIWIGGNRFAHCSLLRYDEVLKKIFEWKEVGSESTFSRFFRKFSLQKNNEIFPSLQHWTSGLYGATKVTLDLDSTVIERYGEQEADQKVNFANNSEFICLISD